MLLVMSYFETITRHAVLVLRYHVFAVFLWIVALGKQHAFVSLCLLIFADATWLGIIVRTV